MGNGDSGIDIVSSGNTIQGNKTGGNNADRDWSFDLNDAIPPATSRGATSPA